MRSTAVRGRGSPPPVANGSSPPLRSSCSAVGGFYAPRRHRDCDAWSNAPVKDDALHLHVETPEEWRSWLAAHHDSEDGVWLVSWRTPTGRPRVPVERAVEEALSFGWIDSKQLRIDDERSKLWLCPRRPGSGWSRVNKARVERLEADGRMTDAGRAVIEAAKADGSW